MFLIPTWVLLAVLAGVGSNLFNFLNRYLLKDKDDPTVYAWYYELLRFVIFSLFWIWDSHLIINPRSLTIFFFLGVTEFFAVYWYMKMHSVSQLSISAILSRTRMIWVPILGFLIIHETLKTTDYFAIFIIFLGTSIVMAPKKLFVDKGALYANISAFMIALNVIFTTMALPYASNSAINAIMSLPVVILFPLLMKNSTRRIKTLRYNNLPLKSAAIGVSIIFLFLFTAALRIEDASKVNAVYQGMLILSVLAGIIFLKERENIARKLIGASITIIGVVLLSFS
jgi:drug/metabolite transporter (DMT)-like permease